jgi:hypothetical protein
VELAILLGAAFVIYLYIFSNSDFTGDMPTPSQMPSITALAQAIATAEGFFRTDVPGGTLPQRHNNPGDLTLGGVNRTFDTPEEGWSALYAQIAAILNGTSHVYSMNMTFLEMAEKWTGGDSTKGNVPGSTQTWATVVAQSVGANPNDVLSDFVVS